MPQPKLEYITLAVSKKIGDEVSVATVNGNLFTSLQRITAINGARQNILNAIYTQLQPEVMARNYEEYVKQSSGLAIAANIFTLPAGVKYILSVRFVITGRDEPEDPDSPNTTPKIATRVPAGKQDDAKYNIYSPYRADTLEHKYIDKNGTVEILGSTNLNGTATIMYITDSIPVVLGASEDIPDPYSLQQAIIDEATKILLTDQQIM